MATILTRAMKNLHKEHATRWGFPVDMIAGSTLGLGVTMMFESGHTEDQIVAVVRQIVADLAGTPIVRGAS